MEHNLIWGLVVLISGIFIASYGNMLFRFVLAFIGFALGFSLIMWVGDGPVSYTHLTLPTSDLV